MRAAHETANNREPSKVLASILKFEADIDQNWTTSLRSKRIIVDSNLLLNNSLLKKKLETLSFDDRFI